MINGKEVNNNFYELIPEELVEVKETNKLIVDMEYPKRGFIYAINKCMLRKSVYEKLLEALNYLPNNYKLKVLDAFRPLNIQKELYIKYKDKIIKDFKLENKSEEEKEAIISKFVSIPQEDIYNVPYHTTGGIVDITLVKDSKDVNLGIEFDEFSDKTNTSYYENTDEEEIKNNRRLLYSVMIKAGFTNLPSECWHFDYGDKAWAYYKKDKIKYIGII